MIRGKEVLCGVHRRVFLFAGAAELAVLIFLISRFFVTPFRILYPASELSSSDAIYMEEFPYADSDGWYADNSIDPSEGEYIHIAAPETDLKAGSYLITLYYSSEDTSYYSVDSLDDIYTVVDRDDSPLRKAGQDCTTTFRLTTPERIDGYQVGFNYSGSGYLFAKAVEIRQTRDLERTWLTVFLLLAALLHLGIWQWSRSDRSRRMEGLFRVFNVMFLCLPLMGAYLGTGHDLEFHLARIEGMTDALRSGQFPVRLPGWWNGGLGYAVSLFYSELFLTVPALFRLIGFTPQEAYKFYVLFVQILAVSISWYSFGRIFRSRTETAAAVFLYTASTVQFSNVYMRAAAGQYTAYVFLPLVLYGVWRLYGEETEIRGKESLRQSAAAVLPLVLGISGVLESHVISTLIIVIALVIYALVCWRRTFRLRTLGRIGLSVILTAALNAWYIVPFMDMFREKYASSSVLKIGEPETQAVFPYQLFVLFPKGTGKSYAFQTGLGSTGEMSFSVGAGLILGGMVYALIRVMAPDRNRHRKSDALFVSSIIVLFMTTYLFPWDFLQRLSPVTALVIKNIQLPWRLLDLGVLLMIIPVVKTCGMLAKGAKDLRVTTAAAAGFVALGMLGTGYMMSDYLNNTHWTYPVDEYAIDSYGISAGEYLPEGVSAEKLRALDPEAWEEGPEVSVRDVSRTSSSITADVVNSGDAESYADFGYLYYRGYLAEDEASGALMAVGPAEDHRVRVVIPPHYEGRLRVFYYARKIWRVSEAVSLLTALLLIGGTAAGRRAAGGKCGQKSKTPDPEGNGAP